jgi:ribose 5-phosphate isomerase B
MKIAIASDHRGVEYKKRLIDYLIKLGYEIIDCSQENTPTDDYPDFAFSVCNKVVTKVADIGILCCRTGIGMSIAANKVKGIRCAKVSSEEEAFLARQHNNANIIALSYKAPLEDLKIMIDKFVSTDFAHDERHVRRIAKISEMEEQW